MMNKMGLKAELWGWTEERGDDLDVNVFIEWTGYGERNKIQTSAEVRSDIPTDASVKGGDMRDIWAVDQIQNLSFREGVGKSVLL